MPKYRIRSDIMRSHHPFYFLSLVPVLDVTAQVVGADIRLQYRLSRLVIPGITIARACSTNDSAIHRCLHD